MKNSSGRAHKKVILVFWFFNLVFDIRSIELKNIKEESCFIYFLKKKEYSKKNILYSIKCVSAGIIM